MKIERFARTITALAIGLVATSISAPSANASLSIPKGPLAACSAASSDYCIESVSLTPVGGKAIALTWVATGGAGATANSSKLGPVSIIHAALNSSAHGLGVGQNTVFTEHGGGVVKPTSLHPQGVV